MSTIGFVAIARNEGERLKLCLKALVREAGPIVYVDSGSTDGSLDFAASLGIDVLNLDCSIPFTMARARNAGWKRLIELCPEISYVHFVDGDCELVEGWTKHALDFLQAHDDVGAVCGRRQERFPKKSLFIRQCQAEWNTPAGEADSCGGESLMRRAALDQSGGFNESLIAGEEPELCLRLRQAAWKIWRIPHDMSLHDAAITSWRQWWRRCIRGGYGAADVAHRVSTGGRGLFADQVRSAMTWVCLCGAGLAAAAVFLVAGFHRAAFGILATEVIILVTQSLKIAWGVRSRCQDFRAALEYGFLTVIAKFPQFLGILRSEKDRRKQRAARIIEYK